MIRFVPSVPADFEQIGRWIEMDPDHAGKSTPEWWTEGTVLSCALEDRAGKVFYVRIDKEGERVRLHIQFAPANEVSKLRVVGAFIDGLPRMIQTMKQMGYEALIFESTSQPLIRFMERMSFQFCGGHDYLRWC